MSYELLIYSLKVGAGLAVFSLFFTRLLSRETFHRFNRIVLLSGVAVSFLLPLCVITVERERPSLPADQFAAQLSAAPAQQIGEAFPWRELAGGLFLAGVAANLLWRLGSLAVVVRLIRRGRRERLDDGTWLIHVSRPVTPFSWGRFVVLSDREPAADRASILAHERAHVRLHHTADLLPVDLAGCLQWFNPAMWLLRRRLRQIHEYEADEAVLKSGVDPRSYQMLLIRRAVGGGGYSVANSLNHSKLEKRIAMMLRKRSSRRAEARVLLLLPLVGLALGAFAETRYVVPDNRTAKKERGMIRIVESQPSVSDVTGRPLILVDGRRVSSLDSIRCEEVASVTVRKDSLARTIYGEEARDGVILVTLRRPDDGAAASANPTVAPEPASPAREALSDVEPADGLRSEAPFACNTVLGAAGGMVVTGPDVMSTSRIKDGRWITTARGRVTADFSQIDEADYRIEINGRPAAKADLERIEPGRIRRVELIRTPEESGRQGVVRVRTRK